ncbi:uncharacterized protein LOC133194522 [Saccostrea echinata]|uniref:uncharacterized protein LOC133194522 n=1 Tax=Saccostrea echinata TaxID=191078 RepID=UPI002A813342|nr:uncharacterized protein LOC133194522 [Saccostrea echinata]
METIYLHQLAIKNDLDEEDIERPSPNLCTALHLAILNGDVDACRREVQDVELVNKRDVRGDSALHLAVRWITQRGEDLMRTLISSGADINVRNKWGQTPLHYAVFVESLTNVNCLLAQTDIDVNVADVNGYTPLHCCFRYKLGGEEEEDREKILINEEDSFLGIAEKLISAGADLNAITKCGNSILHLIVRREDNTPLLKFILEKYPGFNLYIKNNMGENFLHVYVTSEVFEKVHENIEFIARHFPKEIVKTLLNDKDIYGRAPWAHMIDTGNVDADTIIRFLELGTDVLATDSMKNTALHRLAGVGWAIPFLEVLEILINGKIDVNSKNVFGESPAFVIFLEEVFSVLVNTDLDFNAKDRWGRTPLMSVLKHRPRPELLRRMILERNADVNVSDKWGSTPLHIASFHNFEEQVELLLNHGANAFAVDNLKERPLDIVKRHCSYRCHKLLSHTENTELLYSRVKSFEEMLLEMPKCIQSSVIKSKESIEHAMGLPTNRSELFEFLMKTYHERTPENANEISKIHQEVVGLVKTLCSSVASYDKRFSMSIFRTGSSEENTKVGPPDEFDFALCINELKEITCIVITKECKEKGFACLKFSKNPIPENYLQFSDSEGYFLAFPYLSLYKTYLKRALNETSTWTNGHLFFNYEDKMEVISGKPVFNFEVYWIGCVYKQLKISIDLVPVVNTPGWWPKNVYFPEVPEMHGDVRRAGCFLILQTRKNDFNRNNLIAGDDIFETCNNNRDEKTRRMLCISAAPAEIELMKTLPRVFRLAYILAKIMKSKEICPKIEVDELPSTLYTHQSAYKLHKPPPINPSHAIKSYMLKNCTFYLWLELHTTFVEENLTSTDIAGRLFQYLIKFTNIRHLNPFFLPYSDVFEFEKDETLSSYKELLLRLKRELSIKTILGVLNYEFPYECLSNPLHRM